MMASLCFVIVYLFATCAIYVLDDDGKKNFSLEIFYVCDGNQSEFYFSMFGRSKIRTPPPNQKISQDVLLQNRIPNKSTDQ